MASAATRACPSSGSFISIPQLITFQGRAPQSPLLRDAASGRRRAARHRPDRVVYGRCFARDMTRTRVGTPKKSGREEPFLLTCYDVRSE